MRITAGKMPATAPSRTAIDRAAAIPAQKGERS